jgi:hypothetical protein
MLPRGQFNANSGVNVTELSDRLRIVAVNVLQKYHPADIGPIVGIHNAARNELDPVGDNAKEHNRCIIVEILHQETS